MFFHDYFRHQVVSSTDIKCIKTDNYNKYKIKLSLSFDWSPPCWPNWSLVSQQSRPNHSSREVKKRLLYRKHPQNFPRTLELLQPLPDYSCQVIHLLSAPPAGLLDDKGWGGEWDPLPSLLLQEPLVVDTHLFESHDDGAPLLQELLAPAHAAHCRSSHSHPGQISTSWKVRYF